MLSSSLYFTVTVANGLFSVAGVRDGLIPGLDREALAYATLGLTWVATGGTVWSCCVLVGCALHIAVHGPLSKYGMEIEAEEMRDKVAGNNEMEMEAVQADRNEEREAGNDETGLEAVQARGNEEGVIGTNEMEVRKVQTT